MVEAPSPLVEGVDRDGAAGSADGRGMMVMMLQAPVIIASRYASSSWLAILSCETPWASASAIAVAR
jgi:hypothetical protein